MDFQTLTCAIGGGIARLTLNRPDQMNAISPEVLEDLDRACGLVEGDAGVRAVTLTAAGRAFCAGADLRAVRELSPDPVRWSAFMGLWRRVFDRIEALPVPVIAGVHGLALAGGLELVLVADLVVADAAARLGDQHANFGLIAGGGGIPRLIRRIGAQKALDILYTGRWLSGKEAASAGIVLTSVPSEQLDHEVEKLTSGLAKKSRTSFVYMKRVARASADAPLEDALAAEIGALLEYFSTSPHPRRGLQAFLAKETPDFD